MKFGAQFYVTAYTIDAVTLARALEERGFDSFWAPEHAALPAEPLTPYPATGGRIPVLYGQIPDPFVVLSMMAAVTTRMKLATGVCLVTEHHPLILAKTVGSLDRLSGGRLLFGIGTGWLPEVTELINPHSVKPWRYTQEAMAAMTALWRDGAAAFSGEFVSFPESICDPVPVQQPRPPVIVGAQPTDLAMRRIATWGDGWLAMGVTPDGIADARRRLAGECERLGRDPGEIEISVGVRSVSADVREAYEQAGADRLVALLYNHPSADVAIEDWGAAGLARMTAAPPTVEATLRALDFVAAQAGL